MDIGDKRGIMRWGTGFSYAAGTERVPAAYKKPMTTKT